MIFSWIFRTFITFFLIANLSFAFAENTPEKNERLTLNLNKTDIRALIETMSNITGKNFIVDPRVSGEVTVISSTPVTPDEAYEIFISVLHVNGFSIVETGNTLKVIPNMNAKQSGVPTADTSNDTDNIINRVVRIKNSQANQLVPLLRPLLPQEAHLAAHPSSNTLLITDTESNVNRILELIEGLDIKQDSDIEIIRLVNTEASELIKIIEQIQKKTNPQNDPFTNQTTFTADNRTNSIILNGDYQWRQDQKKLIYQLDRPTDNKDDTEVIFLKHATAKDLLEVIKNIGQKQLESTSSGESRSVAVNKSFDVQADESLNAIILSAPSLVARKIKNVISQLDIRRAQVHIQAIIAEIKYEKSIELGVEWLSNSNQDNFVGSTLFPLTGGQTSSILSYDRPGRSSIGSGLTLGLLDSTSNLNVLLKAFASDGDTNILSTPSLLTLDNEEASFIVGQNIPVVTGRYTGTSDTNTGVNPFQTIERQDVGIKLTVKPNINDGDTIKLTIEQEVSDVDDTSNDDGIVTNTRELKTTVLVDDSQIIVLGGLVQDALAEGTSKVPLLGDIPIVGNLFRSNRAAGGKRNLMVFLLPKIIRDSDDHVPITQREYQKMQRMQQTEKSKGIILLDEDLFPMLDNSPNNILQ